MTTTTISSGAPLHVAPQRASARVVTVVLGAMIVLGAGLRFEASRNLFWFDEILSWHVAKVAPHAADIVVNEPLDNSHPLNTVWMYALGDRMWWPAYRLLAVAAGTALLVLMARIALREGAATACIAVILATFSPFLIQYSSEARGYAPAMFFAVACFALARWYLNNPKRKYSLGFTLCAILGVLSHSSFLYAYLAIVLWTGFALWKRETHREAGRLLFRLLAVSFTFLVMDYVILLRRLQTAGGAPYPAWRGARDAIAWIFGWPQSGWMTVLLCGAVAAILIIEIVRMARNREPEWIFYTTVIFIAPALASLAWRQPFVYPRYFAIVAPFVVLLTARFLARAWKEGDPARIGCVMFLALVLWGDARRFAELRFPGRGQYLAAIDYMLAHSNGPLTITSHQDRRNELTLDFYRRYFPTDRSIEYVKQDQVAEKHPQWLLIDCLSDTPPQSSERTTADGSRYRLARVFRYSGLSGFDWWIYEREK